MASLKELTRLSILVAEFERLDASLFDELQARNFDIFDKTLEAKKNVKRYLSELKPLNVAPDVGIKLRKIRDNYGYGIDIFLESLSQFSGKSMSQESEEAIDFVDALFTEGTADYVDQNFFRRKNEVGTLILNYSFPGHFAQHFAKLRECFSLGLFQATLIYCRAVVETGCFEAFRRKAHVKATSQVHDIREFSLKALMRSIKPFVYEPNWDNADKVIKKADEILHSKRKEVGVTEQEAFDAIKDTIAIVEELFAARQQHQRT